MKKYLLGLLVVTLVLTGCQNQSEQSNKATPANQVDQTQEESDETNPLAGVQLEFETEDYDGQVVSNDIFKDSKITVLNLWATWCGPCVEEMPDFEKVSQEMKDKGVQFIGLALDSDEKEVQDLKEKLGITYKLIKENDQLKKQVTSKFDYVPVTVFVDSEGKILGKFIPGSASEEKLKSVIEGLLNE